MDATLNGGNKFTFLVKLEHYTKIIFVILKEKKLKDTLELTSQESTVAYFWYFYLK